MRDKYSAVWVSHSSISDFLKCPRAYYLNNLFRDPQTNNKIQLMSPPLALGQAVHEVLESLSVLPSDKRFERSLLERFDSAWKKISGKKGGFLSDEEEQLYKVRGEEMLRRVMQHPGPLKNKAVKIKQDLPSYWLSPEEDIMLCGKIDWLEYLPEEDAVHVIDFKTSKREENGNSLQLPIYHLLVHNTQHRTVAKASYWYIALHDELSEKKLPDLDQAHQQVLEIAKRIKTQRKLGIFKCPKGEVGCSACQPLEKIVLGQAEYVGMGSYNKATYILSVHSPDLESQSEIL